MISSDWMALITTGSTWAGTCSKSDWTCALYAPKSGSTAGTCGFTPNSDSTFVATGTATAHTAVAYTPGGAFTQASTTSNAILTEAAGIWKLTVSNQQTARVDDSVCVVCRVEGAGLYSSITYLSLKALGPADVLYTTGLPDATPTYSFTTTPATTSTLNTGDVGVAPRKTVTVSGTSYAYGPYFNAGTAAIVTDGADV